MRISIIAASVLCLSLSLGPNDARAQLAWYWYEIVQNDSVAGGDLVVELKVASDRVAPPQNRLRSTTLDFAFDTTQLDYEGFLPTDLTAHSDTTLSYLVFYDLIPAPNDTMMRLTAFSFLDDEILEDVGFVIGTDPVCMAKYRFSIKAPGLVDEPPRLETLGRTAIVTFLDFLVCDPDGSDGCTMMLDNPAEGSTIFVTSRVKLEGAHTDSAPMNTAALFQSHIPLAQPYAQPEFNGTPLDHDIATSLTSVPPGMIDWVLVSLRTGEGPETEVVGSKTAAILLSDGQIVDVDGKTVSFIGVQPGHYFVVVQHRNHLPVMTAVTVDVEDGIGQWDFTTSQASAYADGGLAMRSLDDGSFAMHSADADLDGQVTASDFNLWLSDTKLGVTGYVTTDLNFDGQVTVADFNLWLRGTKVGASSQVPL